MTVHIVVPTFRETDLAAEFLESWSRTDGPQLRIVVVNAEPDDGTSDLVSSWKGRLNVLEIRANPDLFWSGLVSLGLREVARSADDGDCFLLTNIDVRPVGDPLRTVLAEIGDAGDIQVAVPVIDSAGRVVSAGVDVRSWCLSLNHHLGDGRPLAAMPENARLKATYLPTRFLLGPVRALKEGHFPEAILLPHYCADYEYTNRLRRNGFVPVVFTGAHASLSEDNTGFDTYLIATTFRERLARIRDIKCPYHFRYRFNFVRLTYPAIAFVPGLITHFAKIFLEIAFGGRKLQRWRRS